jgi:serine/threonine-protein kinase ATR
LPKPEVVPFRLTQNLVDAFGPTGADGMFSCNLKTAMSTLRENRETLLSVLEPFVKDPVINWKRYRSQQRNHGRSSTNDEDLSLEAKQKMSVIDERLRGIYNIRNPNLTKIRRTDQLENEEDDWSHPIPLSVEGQVYKMIAEATSNENLVQLYVGWMPWV